MAEKDAIENAIDYAKRLTGLPDKFANILVLGIWVIFKSASAEHQSEQDIDCPVDKFIYLPTLARLAIIENPTKFSGQS